MLTKTMITLAALAVFAAAPAAQAGGKDDGPSGGYRIGPLGQVFGSPPAWAGIPQNAYAYVPARGWYYAGSPAYWQMRDDD